MSACRGPVRPGTTAHAGAARERAEAVDQISVDRRRGIWDVPDQECEREYE
jgi:hypothetical protein